VEFRSPYIYNVDWRYALFRKKYPIDDLTGKKGNL